MWQTLIADNPILTKHVRARLRRQHLLPLMGVVIVLAACITWGGMAASKYSPDTAFENAWIILLVLQGLLLFIVGSAQVANAVGLARESGVMDYHRVSPLRPLTLAVGFLLGGPIREYILFACVLPFSFVIGFTAGIGVLHQLAILLEFLLLGLLYHAFSLVCGLCVPKPRNVGLVAVLVLILQAFGAVAPLAYFTIFPTVQPFFHDAYDYQKGVLENASFFGVHLPGLLLLALHQIPLILFLFVAAVRKLRHERAYAFAKPMAVGFFAFMAVLVIGDVLGFVKVNADFSRDAAPLIVMSVLILLGVFMCVAVTPNLGNFIKGMRHARKLTGGHVPLWSDLAVNILPLLACTGILLIAGTLVTYCASQMPLLHREYESGSSFLPLYLYSAVGISALVLLGFGLAQQVFYLAFKKNSMNYFALYLFAFWIIPLLLGMVASIAGMGERTWQSFLAMAPIADIAIVASYHPGSSDSSSTALGIALVSSLLPVLIFAPLYRSVLRRTAQEVALSEQHTDTPSQVAATV